MGWMNIPLASISQTGPTPRVWWGPASLHGPTKVDCHRPHPVRQKMYNASQWTDIWVYAWEYVFSTGIVSHVLSSHSFGTYLSSDAFVYSVYSFVWLFSSCTMCLRRCIHQNVFSIYLTATLRSLQIAKRSAATCNGIEVLWQVRCLGRA